LVKGGRQSVTAGCQDTKSSLLMEVESSDPCAVVEDDSFVHELQQELKRTILGQNWAGSDAPNENKTLEQAANTELIGTVIEAGSDNDERSATEVDVNQYWQA